MVTINANVVQGCLYDDVLIQNLLYKSFITQNFEIYDNTPLF